ncbi:hypothetical protein [Streptomyces sp. NRRL F-5123]|uniref:hypothetical protein n=1 Tax=Streptomyces sp. NRRL F-5123 TaxID=1463856 RepID=UPI0004E0C61A|nr:hypothetical protein [Streptomyces sp. NRRL F-5123]
MTPTSDPYAAALESVLRGVPYNSATEYLHWYDKSDPDPRHGVACIHQTLYVAERAAALGAPKAAILQDMRHIAAVFEDGGAVVVLDPYLMHLTPIVFPADEVRRGHSEVEVDAAPVRRDEQGGEHPARLAAVYRSSGEGYRIRLSYSKYSVKNGAHFLSRHFTLRSENRFDFAVFSADMLALLTHPEQNSVSIRAIVTDTAGAAVTAEAIIPLKGFAECEFSARDVWLRSGQGVATPNGGGAAAEAVWTDLERTTGLGRQDIEEHLVSAAQVYQKIADHRTELPDYRLQDA